MEHEFILKIDEVGELFEEARGTLNKNVSTDCLKSSSAWCSPIRHGSMMMMPSTPLAWRFDSAEFTLKEDYNDFFLKTTTDLDGDDDRSQRREKKDLNGERDDGSRKEGRWIRRRETVNPNGERRRITTVEKKETID
ncbi:hypothetical protein YC2023_032665 [Brassica napus]